MKEAVTETHDEEFYSELQRNPKFDEIIEFVCDWLDVNWADLQNSNSQRVAKARHLIWNMLRLVGWSATEISQEFTGSRWTVYSAGRDEQSIANARAYLAILRKKIGEQS
jgi:hypothetical protein